MPMKLPSILTSQSTIPGVKAVLGMITPTFDSLTVNGVSTFNDDVTINGDLTVNGSELVTTQISTDIIAATDAFTDTLAITGLGNGIAVHTGSGAWVARTLTQPSAGLTISNASGVSGNPTFALANDLGAIEVLNTNGILTRTATDTWAARTITGTANKITVTNGDGISGNPTITIPDAVTLVTPTVTGLLTLSGGQIAFPATQVPSADPNTLDDYEEGTWTPTITAATPGNLSVSYTTQVGRYTKIGRQVFVSGIITTSAFTHTSASGALRVAGLPFMTNLPGTNEASGGPAEYSAGGNTNQWVSTFIVNGVSYIQLLFNGTTGGARAVAAITDHTSGVNSTISFNITYPT